MCCRRQHNYERLMFTRVSKMISQRGCCGLVTGWVFHEWVSTVQPSSVVLICGKGIQRSFLILMFSLWALVVFSSHLCISFLLLLLFISFLLSKAQVQVKWVIFDMKRFLSMNVFHSTFSFFAPFCRQFNNFLFYCQPCSVDPLERLWWHLAAL